MQVFVQKNDFFVQIFQKFVQKSQKTQKNAKNNKHYLQIIIIVIIFVPELQTKNKKIMSKKYIKVTPKGGKPEEARVVLATLETHFRAQKCTIETPTQDEIDEAFPEERIARQGVTTVAKTINDLKAKIAELEKQLAGAEKQVADGAEELKAANEKIAELEKQLAGAEKQPKK